MIFNFQREANFVFSFPFLFFFFIWCTLCQLFQYLQCRQRTSSASNFNSSSKLDAKTYKTLINAHASGGSERSEWIKEGAVRRVDKSTARFTREEICHTCRFVPLTVKSIENCIPHICERQRRRVFCCERTERIFFFFFFLTRDTVEPLVQAAGVSGCDDCLQLAF